MPGDGRRALVTGALGFTGRTLVRQLQRRGYDVTGTSRRRSVDDAWARLDFSDGEAATALLEHAAPDVVFHLSGLARTYGPDLEAYRRANVLDTEALLTALAGCRAGARLVLMSSAAVYAPPADGILSETAALRPASPYGRSKLEMEQRAGAFAADLSIAIARPFNYTGPGQSEYFVAARIAGEAARGATSLVLGALTPQREFNDVEAVAASLVRLAETDHQGPVNIASGRALSIQDLVDATAEVLGRPLTATSDPARLRADDPPLIVGDPALLTSLSCGLDQPPIGETIARMLQASANSA